jgi:hypothetical protein
MPDRADVEIARYLAENLYHPRSSKHGDALCAFLLADLLRECAAFRRAAERDAIVYRPNYTIDPLSPDRWNADLVVGPPTHAPEPRAKRVGAIAEGDPSEIWLAIDAKTIMTEHGKARRNRQRDLNSFQDILHKKNRRTIVGGLLIVNIAERFQTPLARQEEGITNHRNIVRLVEEIVTLMGALARSTQDGSAVGLEALGVIVVSHSNVRGEPTKLVLDPPAPKVVDPLSYQTFLGDLCVAFSHRFGNS